MKQIHFSPPDMTEEEIHEVSEALRSRCIIFDFLLIFLNLSNSYSIIPYFLFFQHSRTINTALIFLLNIFYIGLRFNKGTVLPRHNSLFVVYFIITLFNSSIALYTNMGYFSAGFYFCTNISFFILLYNCYYKYSSYFSEKECQKLLLRPYIWLCLINIIGIAITYILINIGFSPYVNNISNRMDLFVNNIQVHQVTYYFPYFSTLLESNDIRIPFFQSKGFLCGMYHEPHILTFMLFPAFFILWGKSQNLLQRLGVIFIYIFIALIAGSTTNIFAFFICISIWMLRLLKNNIIIPLTTISLIVCIFLLLDISNFTFILEKLQSGSKDYSLKMIQFAFMPKTLIGSNILNTDYVLQINTKMRDVGFIMFSLNITFLIILMRKIYKLIFSQSFMIQMIGLATLYFFLHSMKVAMVSYSLSFLTFFIFFLSIYSSKNKSYSIE